MMMGGCWHSSHKTSSVSKKFSKSGGKTATIVNKTRACEKHVDYDSKGRERASRGAEAHVTHRFEHIHKFFFNAPAPLTFNDHVENDLGFLPVVDSYEAFTGDEKKRYGWVDGYKETADLMQRRAARARYTVYREARAKRWVAQRSGKGKQKFEAGGQDTEDQ
uniref:Uncharacterized protein n=1 Tax=Prymnesium polylepis TaxID=72548 RepID=A0A7S4JG40_9EUKA